MYKILYAVIVVALLATSIAPPARAQTTDVIELVRVTNVNEDAVSTFDTSGTTGEMILIRATAGGVCDVFTGNAYLCDEQEFDIEWTNISEETQTVYICVLSITRGADTHTRLFNSESSLSTYRRTSYELCVTANNTVAPDTTLGYQFRSESWVGNEVLSYPEGTTISYETWIAISFMPINTCDYAELASDTITLDPTIETPLGPQGEPADEQIFPTVTGEIYALLPEGGPWNDGAADRGTDTAISWDGETYTPIDALIPTCFGDTVYVEAESDTLYVRVNDTSGNFADNTNNPDPVTVTIVLVGEPVDCDSQFTYSVGDWVGSVNLEGTDEDGQTLEAQLVPGDWYAIAVAPTDRWQDDGVPPDRADMEYYNGTEIIIDMPFTDLSTGSNTWCQSEDGLVTYIQAGFESLTLRVNNESGDFSTNTGHIDVDIYHTAFTRRPQGCEVSYQIGNSSGVKTVAGNQQNGLNFAYMPSDTRMPYVGVTAGAWYVLDTMDGPWTGVGTTGDPSYDMAVSEDGTNWTPLSEWGTAVCNVPLDALGHRRVIFQIPATGPVEWKLRVNDYSMWWLNGGEMSWQLYDAVKLSIQPEEGTCAYTYDELDVIDSGTVYGNNANGVTLDNMAYYQVYALVIAGDPSWKENSGGGALYDMELSDNNGTTYDPLPDGYPGTLCSEQSGVFQIIYLQPGANYRYKLRVDSETFTDNEGKMAFWVYPATPDQGIVNTCFDGFHGELWLQMGEWIDVQNEQGEEVLGETARYEEFTGLKAGRMYMIEAPVTNDRWYNSGETNKHSDFALSNDGGDTWEPVEVRDSLLSYTMYDCASVNPIGNVYRVLFTVQEGDLWKIRVNDTAGGFADNRGALMYKMQQWCPEGETCDLSIPDDGEIPAVTVGGTNGGNVCFVPLVRPQGLDVAEWLNYLNFSLLRYMAWCDSHTSMVLRFLDTIKQKEPFATVTEAVGIARDVKTEIESYDWGENSGNDTSLFDARTTQDINDIIDNFILVRTAEATNPWNGFLNVDLESGAYIPPAYYSCNTAFSAQLPSRLRQGVCFASAWMTETNASIWIQLSLDVSAIFMIIMATKRGAQEVIYMMTGVKPWTKSGIRTIINDERDRENTRRRLINGRLSDPDPDDLDAQELSRMFGGRYGRDSDGSYRRR